MKTNTIQNSMAGVGGLSQCNAINDLDLANAPFCPTAEPCAPDHLANLKLGDPTPSPPDEREAIVRWLRECQAIHESRIENGPHKTASRHHADACKYASAAIERGEHLDHVPSEQGEGYE